MWRSVPSSSFPRESMLRGLVNLIDNPGVLGKELMVKGTIGSFLGLDGIVDSRGGNKDFRIDGAAPGEGTEPPAPAGSGTEADPYNISFVMQSAEDLNGVWIEGYVAGYVVSGDFNIDNVEFSANEVAGSTNYLNQTNIVMSAVAPMGCGVRNSVRCKPI